MPDCQMPSAVPPQAKHQNPPNLKPPFSCFTCHCTVLQAPHMFPLTCPGPSCFVEGHHGCHFVERYHGCKDADGHLPCITEHACLSCIVYHQIILVTIIIITIIDIIRRITCLSELRLTVHVLSWQVRAQASNKPSLAWTMIRAVGQAPIRRMNRLQGQHSTTLVFPRHRRSCCLCRRQYMFHHVCMSSPRDVYCYASSFICPLSLSSPVCMMGQSARLSSCIQLALPMYIPWQNTFAMTYEQSCQPGCLILTGMNY